VICMIVRSNIHPYAKICYPDSVNIYDSTIGEGTKIASFVDIGIARIGKFCIIEAFSFLPPGTVIEDYVYIGPHVTIMNDRHPDAKSKTWKKEPVTIKNGASIGAGSIIFGGVTVGENAIVDAGSVVSHNVPAGAVIDVKEQVLPKLK